MGCNKHKEEEEEEDRCETKEVRKLIWIICYWSARRHDHFLREVSSQKYRSDIGSSALSPFICIPAPSSPLSAPHPHPHPSLHLTWNPTLKSSSREMSPWQLGKHGFCVQPWSERSRRPLALHFFTVKSGSIQEGPEADQSIDHICRLEKLTDSSSADFFNMVYHLWSNCISQSFAPSQILNIHNDIPIRQHQQTKLCLKFIIQVFPVKSGLPVLTPQIFNLQWVNMSHVSVSNMLSPQGGSKIQPATGPAGNISIILQQWANRGDDVVMLL